MVVEYLLADAQLDDLDRLLNEVHPGVRVIRVPRDADAHTLLAAVLAKQPRAVHLLAHGAEGRVFLGRQALSAASLLDRAWPQAPGSEILVHACRVAAGAEGRRFVARLAAATGATVAAATQPVGHTGLGGAWELDVASAPVTASLPFGKTEAWRYVLAITPNDPLYPQQWHLHGPNSINADQAWEYATGRGITVGIIDDGIEYTHPDLAANYDTSRDYDGAGTWTANGYLPDDDPSPGPGDDHGTHVAGIVAEVANNGIGGSGVAPNATIVGYRYAANDQPGETYLLARQAEVDVSNNSWRGIDFTDLSAPGQLGYGIASAVRTGRSGLGTVVVFGAGNDRQNGTLTTYSQVVSTRHTIAVGNTQSNGEISGGSTPGDSLLVSAPGSRIWSTDRTGAEGYDPNGDYIYNSGTSMAAPVISGTAALMLSANRSLGYRDVQDILAMTARRTGGSGMFEKYSWGMTGAAGWNGGGMHFSTDYGFGLVDAAAAVRVAESWHTAPRTEGNVITRHAEETHNATIPDNSAAGVSRTLTLDPGVRVEHMEIRFSLTHDWWRDLQMTLTGPDGQTQSLLFDHPPHAFSIPIPETFAFTMDSARFRGMDSGGTWTLTVKDTSSDTSNLAGVLSSWSLTAYGSPQGDDTYVYTGEFAGLAAADPSRRTLSDAGGQDRINTAALTSDTRIDLTPGGSNSRIDGQAVTIAAGTLIEGVDSGDGNDTLIGNDAANDLWGWRGNDALNGGAGADTLVGGAGDDTLTGGGGNDLFLETGTGDGHDTITDFQLGDVLRVAGATAIRAEAVGGGALLHVDTAGGTLDVTLQGITDTSRLRLSGGDVTLTDPPPPGVLSIGPASVSHAEGAAGARTNFAFTVTRSGGTAGAASVHWAVAGSGTHPADAADFGGALPGGLLSFADGEAQKSILVSVAGDGVVEADEGFTVTLSQPTGATLQGAAGADGLILNDDTPPPVTGGGGSSGGGSSNGGGGGGSVSPVSPPTTPTDASHIVAAAAAAEALPAVLAGLNLDGSAQAVLTAGLAGYAATLPPGATVALRTVAPTDGAVLAGSASDALVVDGRGLAGGSVQLAGVGYAGVLGAVQVQGGASNEAVAGDDSAQALLLGDGNDTGLGGGGNDALYGNQGADVLYGNQGSDTLYGGRDADTILGGRDTDELNGNLGDDLVNGNLGDDVVHGGQGNDTVRGGQNQDLLYGDLGNDELWGDLGDDTLVGGLGADRFCFAPGSGRDVIVDFDLAGGDRIVLAGMGYTLGQDGAGNAVIVFSAADSVTLSGVRREQIDPGWIVAL